MTFIWNHRVHQQWADENLTFWRFAFFPRFSEGEVVAVIERVLKEQNVSSYAIYETLGLFDLFVRAWLPSQSHENVEASLNEALQGQFLQLLESFTVTKVLRHHVWDDGKGGLREPEASVLERPLSDEDIAAVNEGRLGSERRASLETDRLIAPLEPHPGIKFFTIITSPVFSTTFNARKRLEEDLLGVLNRSRVQELSLYAGSGFGNFVLMGRSRPDDYFAIPALAIEINDLGLYESFIARPYTHLCGSETMLAFDECIPTASAESRTDVQAMLETPESRQLEVKGSLYLNWRRWLASEGEQPVSDEEVLNDGLVKAVVGMLNSEGGHVILGALEADRFSSSAEDQDSPLARAQRIGDYLIVGVDAEERFAAGNWDGFRLHIQDILTSRIDPSPAGLINVTSARLGERTLAVIRVQPSATTWFYRFLGTDKPVRFFVREDGRTVTYTGSDADNYKRARPRG